MTTELMTEWLKTVDKQMKRQGRKILLFLDNAPAHPNLQLNNIKLAFLPANTTSLTQPMDQGIIQAMKLKYRSRQMQHILNQMERTQHAGSDILRQISILDAIYWINSAWKEVETSTVQKCFVRCGFSEEVFSLSDLPVTDDGKDSDDDEDDDIPLAVLRLSKSLFDCEFSELCGIDDTVPTQGTGTINWEVSASEILDEMRNNNDDEEEEESQSECETAPISLSEAQDCLDKLKSFALNKGQHTILDSVMSLQELFVACRTEVTTTQKKISDFFH